MIHRCPLLWLMFLLLAPEVARAAPRTAGEAFEKGVEAILADRKLEAVSLLREAIRLDPTVVEYRLVLCDALIEMDRLVEADRAAEEGLAAHPDHLDLLLLRGEALGERRRWAQALPHLNKAVAASPENVLALTLAGKTQVYCGEDAAGMARLRKARELAAEEERSWVLRTLAEVLVLRNRRAEAAETLEALARIQPDRFETWFDLAKLYAAAELWTDVERTAREAAMLAPDDPRPAALEARAIAQLGPASEDRLELLYALPAAGEFAAFDAAATEFLREPPADCPAERLLQFAGRLIELGLVDFALKAADAAAARGDETPAVFAARAAALLGQGRLEEATTAAGRAGEAGRGVLARIGEARRRQAEAKDDEKTAAARRTAAENAAAPNWNQLGVALYAARRYEEAAGAFRRALDLNPVDPLLHANLGDTLRMLDLPHAAGVELARALAVDPSARNRNLNGLVLIELGLYEEAEKEFAAAQAMSRDGVFVRNRMDAYRGMGRNGLAEEAMLAYLDSGLPATGADRNFFGNFHHSQERYAEAVNEYEIAIRLGGDVATFHANKAGSLLKLGRRDEALAAGRMAVELGKTADKHWALKELGL